MIIINFSFNKIMAQSTVFTTFLVLILFVPATYLLLKSKMQSKLIISISNVFIGGSVWSFLSFIQYLIFILFDIFTDFQFANEITHNSFVLVQNNSRTILFWYLFIFALISQITLHKYTSLMGTELTSSSYGMYGLGWGISEFIQRFLFFTPNNGSLILYFVLYCLIINTLLGLIMIRVTENSKFIMFNAILKFFAELGMHGEIGYSDSIEIISLSNLYLMLLLVSAIGILSLITRRFPLKED